MRVRYGKVEELQRKLKKEVPQKEDLMRNMLLERDEARHGLADVDRQIEDVGVQISTTQGILRNLEGQSTDRLSAFGANLPKVLEEIRRARWNHSAPIGPLGLYVRLEDMRYKDAFHSLLGQNMCTFAVRHSGDKATMLKILQHCGKV